MKTIETDIVVIGSGFGGSLTALLAHAIGKRVMLVERGVHPRFAIGESSTPIADLVLRKLAEKYDLPRIAPLTQYGSWRRTYPELTCGLKRGFSYFRHEAGQAFIPREDHTNELLVAASPNDEHGDTHWLRADFDAFLVGEVQSAGIPYLDRMLIEDVQRDSPWRISGTRSDQRFDLRAGFIVDASGGGGVLASALDIEDDLSEIKTHSRTIYSHFSGVKHWETIYRANGGQVHDHPFSCDASALHHIFDGGWMWVLRFDNGVTSAGFVLDLNHPDGKPVDDSVSPEAEWAGLLERFPSIQAQFAGAVAVQPIRRSLRLQRRWATVAGSDWAMLPHAAGFIDPLHSGGNAHTLCGIERLIGILETSRDENERAFRLKEYDRIVRHELCVLDKLIHGCYASFNRFELMTAYSMFYFAGAIWSEEARRDGRHKPDHAFLCAHDQKFCEAVATGYDTVVRLARDQQQPTATTNSYLEDVARLIESYNNTGLCDAAKRNMYSYKT